MPKPEYIYVIYIDAPCEKVFDALIDPELNKEYWGRHCNLSDWKTGSPWQHADYDDRSKVVVAGTVIESARPHRLVLSWARPESLGDPDKTSRVTFAIDELIDQAHGGPRRAGYRDASRHQRRLAANLVQPEDVAGNRRVAADDAPPLEKRQLTT